VSKEPIVKHGEKFKRIFSFAFAIGLIWLAAACRTPASGSQALTPHPDTLEPTLTASFTTTVAGLGVLGDSNSDEYRADDDRGGAYASITFSWVELIAARRGLNLGPWGTWDEPRRTGFKYNWSRSGETTHDAIESGQHTGLAAQVASGEVSHVIVWIGTNDFASWNGNYQEIYDGRLNGKALQAKLDAIVADITLAVDTITRAGQVNLLLATIPERPATPDMMRRFPAEAGRRQVNEAIRAVNTRLMTMASSRGIAVVDSNALMQALFQRMDKTGALRLGNEQINVLGKGSEPHYGQLDDEAGHPGTILSGLIANEIVIRPLDEQLGANIPPLSDEEILQSAGLLGSK
jgi:phospholipase/lecithinase/hemolysin